MNLQKIYKGRFALLFLLFSIFIALSFIIRTILLIKSWTLLIDLYGSFSKFTVLVSFTMW